MPLLDLAVSGLFPLLRSPSHVDSLVLVASTVRLGFSSLVLDFVHSGSFLSLRGSARLGFFPLPSDFAELGPPPLLHSYA